MAQETIDFGAYPNDPDSDAIRVAFQKTQNNFNELFSIRYQTGVSQILEGAGISLNTNTGNVTVTNRISNVTIQTDANLIIGVTTASSNTATINSGTTPFVLNLANSISTGNITATGKIEGVLSANSNSQPNITTVGNLANLSVVGTIRSDKIISNTFNVVSLTATYLGSPGSNQQVLFNSLGNVYGNPNLIFTGSSLNIIGGISATGNANVGNLFQLGTTGVISAAGNVQAKNLQTTGVISATGNIIGSNFVGKLANGTSNISIPSLNGNITFGLAGNANVVVMTNLGANVNGYANITGLVTVGNLSTTGEISATSDITGGNLISIGNISATNNITGQNLNVANAISATGNANVGNLVSTGNVSAISYITGGNLISMGDISAIGNANVINLRASGFVSATGNANVGNLFQLGTTGVISAAGNVQAKNLRTTGVISATGNITGANANLGNLVIANYFSGDGTSLFNLQGANIIGNVLSANVSFFANVNSTTNENITTYLTFVDTTSGNANLVTDSTLSYNTNSKVLSANALSLTGNIVAGNLNVQTGTLTGINLSTGANTTVGYITGNWLLTAGSLLRATYADLAEYYSGDQKIESGTVVEFGGSKEVTICTTECSDRIAGVVSTNPAYVMNSMIEADYPIAVALQGRVPVKVTGVINKGDMLVSAGNGLAKSHKFPVIGSVIGKALQDFSGTYGIIEVAIGRL